VAYKPPTPPPRVPTPPRRRLGDVVVGKPRQRRPSPPRSPLRGGLIGWPYPEPGLVGWPYPEPNHDDRSARPEASFASSQALPRPAPSPSSSPWRRITRSHQGGDLSHYLKK
jgi:hypothetical protein